MLSVFCCMHRHVFSIVCFPESLDDAPSDDSDSSEDMGWPCLPLMKR